MGKMQQQQNGPSFWLVVAIWAAMLLFMDGFFIWLFVALNRGR